MDDKLLIMLGEMKSDIKSLHEKTDAILTQATKTNGRVSALENWKANLMGKIAVVVAVVSFGITTVLKKFIE